jgi:putative glutamine transport system substrate-binding protein
MLKKAILSILFLTFLCAGCGKKAAPADDLKTIEERGHIIVGIRQDTRPFGFVNGSGQPDGYEADLAKLVAKNLLGSESNVKFVPVTAENRIMKLDKKEVDILIATMSITPQREVVLNFSAPYYVAGQAVMVNSGSKATNLRDFENKKMIVVFGSTGERDLRANVPGVTIIGYKTYPEAYRALKAGKADGMIADDTVLYGFAINDGSVKILSKRYSQEPYAVGFRNDPDSARLQSKVNDIIERLQSTGELNKLQSKWNVKK